MTTKVYEPILVDRHVEQIKKETENWTTLIFSINDLIQKWNLYFSEKIDLPELDKILNDQNLEFNIQVKKIQQNPKHADFIKSLNVKVEKLIDMVEIPDFSHLVNAIFIVKMALKQVSEAEFDRCKSKLFDSQNQCFELKPEFELEIQEKYSVYASRNKEILAYLLVNRFCLLINLFNNMGGNVGVKELPDPFKYLISSFQTDKKYSEFVRHFSDPKYWILNFKPSIYMLKPDSSLMLLIGNLSENEINDLINNLK